MILLLVVFGGLVWWFVNRRSTQRRRHTRPENADGERAHTAPVVRHPTLVVGPAAVGAVVEMIGVTKSYGRGLRQRLALDELDLAVPPGMVFGLLGPNGAGKTTALRCVLGLVSPTAGTCRVLAAPSWL
ncbi:MAG: ATP-binding cassette domain-containing protein [Acidimicrobiia bacterium]